jgi:hypothetical protein
MNKRISHFLFAICIITFFQADVFARESIADLEVTKTILDLPQKICFKR